MKKSMLCVVFNALVYMACAQTSARHISFRTIDKDSVMMPLDDKYYLIEDSCAQIIRYSRFDFQNNKFFGRFKDVSKIDPALTVAEGTYSSNGLKNGLFTTHYLNGNLQSRGSFKDDNYDGKWEMYYNDGKPELTFEVANGDLLLTGAWDADGAKTVDNGNGVYVDNIGAWYWIGKLVDGKPDGKWKFIGTKDATTTLATEHFKKGKFTDGVRGDFSYNDASHIVLVSPLKLPFVNGEKMFFSQFGCQDGQIVTVVNPGSNRKQIVNARYKDGFKTFSSYIDDVVTPYLHSINLSGLNYNIDITGEVAENGGIVNLKNNATYREDIARGLMLQLRSLPALLPATLDGKPVREKFTISFKFYNNMYEFSYRFLPFEN